MNISRNILTALAVLGLSTCAWAQNNTATPDKDLNNDWYSTPNTGANPVRAEQGSNTAPQPEAETNPSWTENPREYQIKAKRGSDTSTSPTTLNKKWLPPGMRSTDLRDAPNDPMIAADRALADSVRKALAADAALQTQAKNVKVSANRGQITLKGKVASEDEKIAVGAAAAAVAGTDKVTNKLKVKSARKMLRKDDTKNDDEGVLR